MKKTLYIDMACIVEQVSPITFAPGVFQYLSRLGNDLDYTLVLCVPDDQNEDLVNDVLRFCKGEDILFEDVVDPIKLTKRLTNEKDQDKLLISSATFAEHSLFQSSILYLNNKETLFASGKDWAGIYKQLSANHRKATVIRKTSETDIQCFLNLDGTGQNKIATGLGFFDHMLQQIARHGNVDLDVKVAGDLHIDEHHTIEDVGLALGAAFNEALGNKKGIERYGFLLPMDDCLAQVALDFGGRPWLVWDADFKREKVGDMPTEMFHHFFKSFSDAARCNLNIKAEGSNEHHKIESIFKAFAKSIAMAISKNNTNIIPSTKGSL